jgi:hypothetical protein
MKLARQSDKNNTLRKLNGFKPSKPRQAIIGSAFVDLALYILLGGKV